MIYRSVHEWGYLRVSDEAGDDAVTRAQADGLIAVARRARVSLGASEIEAERILLDGSTRLRAQQVVGVLSSPTVSLEILPKIDGVDEGKTRINLVRMLARTLDLTIAHGSLTSLGRQQHDLLEILIRLFCDKMFEVVHRGLPRRYVQFEGDRPALRGRLDAIRQFTVLAVAPQRLACRYSELSQDIALNQILKAAVGRLRNMSRAAENQRRLSELSTAFSDVSAVPRLSLPWDKVVLDRTNTVYRELLRLAELLLGKKFQTTSLGANLGFSLLFEMNTLFEEYIGRTLRSALRDTGLSVTLQGPRSYALFEVGANKKRFMTKPDIVIHCDGKPAMVVDTKWKRLNRAIDDPKRGVAQSDVYQMMAYAQVYEVERLLLLYPHHDELGLEEGILVESKIIRTENSLLIVGAIGLGELDTLPGRLRSLVCNMVGGRHVLQAHV